MERIDTLIDLLEVKARRSELLGKLHIVIMSAELRELLQELGREETILMLAVQIYAESQRKADHGVLKDTLDILVHAIKCQGGSVKCIEAGIYKALPEMTGHGPRTSGPETAPVQLIATTRAGHPVPGRRTPKIGSLQHKLRLRSWFLHIVYTFPAFWSSPGWNAHLYIYKYVDPDAHIFRLCREGDIDAVRRLIEGGHASPLDREATWGQTTLNVCVQFLVILQS